MVQVRRVYNNREKNNVLSVGKGKKSKKMSYLCYRAREVFEDFWMLEIRF